MCAEHIPHSFNLKTQAVLIVKGVLGWYLLSPERMPLYNAEKVAEIRHALFGSTVAVFPVAESESDDAIAEQVASL